MCVGDMHAEGRNSFREHFPRLEDFAKAIYIFYIDIRCIYKYCTWTHFISNVGFIYFH